MGMPFDYQADALEGLSIRTENSKYIPLIIGPWGSHASPHTGHPTGNPKVDMMAVLAHSPAQLQTFTGESCIDYALGDPHCGMPRDDLLELRPYYKVPNGFSANTLAAMEEQGIRYSITNIFMNFQGDPGTDNWYY